MCRTGCPTQDHATWGECARAASFKVAYCGIGGGDATGEKNLQKELAAYRDAKRQGIQPRSTSMRDTRKAVEISNRAGAPYQAA